MRHFRLKRTITHASVLSALFPTGVALSHQVQIPIGLNGKIVVAASASALIGHQATPAGFSLMDPKNAPARGGYVYDAFNRVVRTGVTGECVKHGLWTPELATPECEPWLFAKPTAAAPAKAAEPAPKAEAPAPKAEAPAPKAEAPAPAPKAAEGFPEWIGPDEFRLGIVPIWPENQFDAPDNIGLPRMYFDGDESAHGDHVDDLISSPTVYGDHAEHESDASDHIGAPIVYYHEEDGAAAGDNLISAPRYFEDDAASSGMGQWPADPYAAGIPEDISDAEESDQWMPTPHEQIAAPAAGIMEFKEEGVWPANPYSGEYLEDRPLESSDDSWVIPNPMAGNAGAGAVAAYEEGGKEPEELISNPLMYFDTEDHGVIPAEDIIGHRLVQDADEHSVVPAEDIIGHTVVHEGADGSDRPGADDHIIGHTIIGNDSRPDAGSQDDLIGTPRVYESGLAPYDGSEFNAQPFPSAEATDEPEGEPFNAEFVPQDTGAPADAAPAPVQITDSGLAWQSGEDEDDDNENAYTDALPLMAKDASAGLPYPGTPTAASSAPAYGPAEEDDDDEEEPYTPDYSKVPTAKGANDNLPAPAASQAAPAPEKPAAPAAKEEEHLMTVVLSADALFEFDRYAVRKGGNKSLREFVDAVKQVKWGQILVVGHTDRLGSDKYNLRLSERRAQTVRRELVKLGLDGKKIKAVGKGKSEPVTKDCVGDKRSKALIECLQPDRRVEIFVDEKQQVIIKKAPGKK